MAAEPYERNYDEKVIENEDKTFSYTLKAAPQRAPKVDDTHREALGVQLKKREARSVKQQQEEAEGLRKARELQEGGKKKERAPELDAPEEVRKEALEIQLKKRGQSVELEVEVEGEKDPEKEGLNKLGQLNRVPSAQRGKSFIGARPSMTEMRKRASSFLQMGGVKPSLLKAKGKQAEEPRSAEDDGDEFLVLLPNAHNAMKELLAKQQEELARLEAKAEAERKAAERKERAVRAPHKQQQQQQHRQQHRQQNRQHLKECPSIPTCWLLLLLLLCCIYYSLACLLDWLAG